MSKVIIFGNRDYAELAAYYLKNDSPHEVVAFCVHEKFLNDKLSHLGLPLIAFENIENIYPPNDFKFFAPMSPSNMNRDRRDIFNQIKAKAYSCISYVSSKACLFNSQVGENCFILEGNNIQPQVSIGSNVLMWSGNHIGHHSNIDNDVGITSHVVISGHCNIAPFSFFGVNSTIRDSINIAEGTLVVMSSSVFQDTDPWSVYRGNPARKLNIPSTKVNI